MATNKAYQVGGADVRAFERVAAWVEVIAHAPLAFAITSGAAHNLCFLNTSFEHLIQTIIPTSRLQTVVDVLPIGHEQAMLALFDHVLHTGTPAVRADLEHVHPTQGSVYWTYTVWPIPNAAGQPAGLVVQVQETTAHVLARRQAGQSSDDLRQVNEQLLLASLREQALAASATEQAFHDPLTGLANRSLLMNRLEQALHVTHRAPSPFALLLLDLDRFKTVNDQFGHLAGDQLLREIAHRLTACLRPEDTVARLGGDEFAILLAEIGAVSEVVHIAVRIQQSLSTPCQLGKHAVCTSASIGIVLHTPEYTQPEALLRDADIALYRAKALGKARHVIFDPTLHAQALALAQLEAELRHALANEEFALHYQPIIALPTGRLMGVEALVRWQHPARGELMPEAFLSVAEATSLIVPLDEWVLATACAQARAWHAADLPPVYMTVNLSAHQLKQRNLAATITTLMQQTGLPPALLHVELTESNVMDDVGVASLTLQQLTALGVRVAVDDFGTGYSSLPYLKRLPLTTVKIDRSFVAQLTTDPDAAAIVSATIAMAHCLGFQVIAEGVETTAQLAYLRAAHCDAVQGHLISPPLSADAMRQRLAHKDWLPTADLQPGGN